MVMTSFYFVRKTLGVWYLPVKKNRSLDGGGILYFNINASVLGGLRDLCRSFKFENRL